MPDFGQAALKVLGCSGSRFDETFRILCSSYLVETTEVGILLDCGFGSFESFLAYARGTVLDALVISHAHADHVADLELFMDCGDLWRDKPKVIASEATLTQVVRDTSSFPNGTFLRAIPGVTLEHSDVFFDFSTTTHKMPTIATCVSIGNKRVAHCADTDPTWVVPENFVRADLAILECTLERREIGNVSTHLDALEATDVARRLSSAHTMLTHVPPGENSDGRFGLASTLAPELSFFMAHVGLKWDL